MGAFIAQIVASTYAMFGLYGKMGNYVLRWCPMNTVIRLSLNSIGAKLMLGFSVVLGFLILNIGVGWVQLNQLGHTSENLTNNLAVSERQAHQWQDALSTQALTASSLLVTADPDKLKPLLAAIMGSSSRINELHDAYLNSTSSSNDERSVTEKVHSRQAQALKSLLEAVTSGSSDFMRSEFYDTYLPAVRDYKLHLEQRANQQQSLMDQGRTAADLELSHGIRVMLGVGALACAVASWIAWYLSRSINLALREAVHIANVIADGDLSFQKSSHAKGEFQLLADAQEQMRNRLRTALGSILDSAESVQIGSGEIASANQNLSTRTEQQAATLQSTASVMTNLMQGVDQNALTVHEASTTAQSVSVSATERYKQIAELVRTMKDISVSSTQIADITAVIEGIAFQTNILALNAAVESARAGEHGRGFAVVANEVRTLAQRSSKAAREIDQLIRESVTRVEKGVTLANAAGNSIGELVSSVQSVATLLHQVASLTEAQRGELTEISHSLASLDDTTQQNAAMSEEGAAAARSLKDQADQLKIAASTFNLANSETDTVLISLVDSSTKCNTV